MRFPAFLLDRVSSARCALQLHANFIASRLCASSAVVRAAGAVGADRNFCGNGRRRGDAAVRLQFMAQIACRLNHVPQRRFGLRPGAGFEAAVRVDPKSFGRDELRGAAQQSGHVGRRRHAGRMNVVHAGADIVRVGEGAEAVEQFHIRARGFDGDDVGVHGRDGRQNVVELRVAHMGVNLRVIARHASRHAERSHRPAQVLRPVVALERQALAEGGFVDLDDGDARVLQITHLVAHRQRELQRHLVAREIVAHEAPLQQGDRPGEHALDRPRGECLRVPRGIHRHRLGPPHIAPDDGRLDAARTIALHPAARAEGVAPELFAEKFHHVVAFGLAMHQHVQVDVFLFADDGGDLFAHFLQIVGMPQFAAAPGGAGSANFGGLREGADGGRGQRRQVQSRVLRGDALGIGRATPGVGLAERLHAAAHLRQGHARTIAARRQRLGVGPQRVAHGVFALIERRGEHTQFLELLFRKGQPGTHFGVEPRARAVFCGQTDGHMQQRTRRRDPQPLAQRGVQRPQDAQRSGQVAAPHIATVDDARRQHPLRRQRLAPEVDLLRRAHQIEMHAIDRQTRQRGRGEADRLEVGAQQQLGAQRPGLRGQRGVKRGQQVAPGRVEIEGERGFVKLHPFHPQFGQPGQHPGVGARQRGR